MATDLALLYVPWVIQAVTGLLLAAPVVSLSWHRVQWQGLDLLAFVLPFTLWTVLYMTPFAAGRGTLSNLVAEPFFLGVAIAVVALLRVWAAGTSLKASVLLVAEIALLCLVAAGLFFFVPALPE